MEIFIDATDMILGRLCSYAAKRALLGDDVKILNCENALMTGNKADIFAKYRGRRERGRPSKGPFFPTLPDRIVRRTVRGMLPYKKAKGRAAFEKVMCYIGVPEDLKKKKLSTLKEADISKARKAKYVTVGAISKQLRG